MERPYAILCEEDGQPLTIGIGCRESESAPGRIKACFYADAEHGVQAKLKTPADDGMKLLAPPNPGTAVQLGVEFRIELN